MNHGENDAELEYRGVDAPSASGDGAAVRISSLRL
jgi:hypothetical protein